MDVKLFKEIIKLIGKESVYLNLQVRSLSMLPLLEDGDRVVLKTTRKVKRGDIVVFMRRDYLVIHRVVLKFGKLLITKGDNKKNFDYPVLVDKIMGKVVAVVKNEVA